MPVLCRRTCESARGITVRGMTRRVGRTARAGRCVLSGGADPPAHPGELPKALGRGGLKDSSCCHHRRSTPSAARDGRSHPSRLPDSPGRAARGAGQWPGARAGLPGPFRPPRSHRDGPGRSEPAPARHHEPFQKTSFFEKGSWCRRAAAGRAAGGAARGPMRNTSPDRAPRTSHKLVGPWKPCRGRRCRLDRERGGPGRGRAGAGVASGQPRGWQRSTRPRGGHRETARGLQTSPRKNVLYKGGLQPPPRAIQGPKPFSNGLAPRSPATRARISSKAASPVESQG